MRSAFRYDFVALLLFAGCFVLLGPASSAQALPASSRSSQFSAFVLAGDVYTGLGGFGPHIGLGGRNVAVTLGLDYGFYEHGAYQVMAEGRGTYPVYRGHVDGQEDLLGGLRVERSFRRLSRLHVYGDILAGRGEMQYVDGGYAANAYLYSTSSSAVYGGGAGLEVNYRQHWAFVTEAQVQHWGTPVTQEGRILAKTGSGGIIYRF